MCSCQTGLNQSSAAADLRCCSGLLTALDALCRFDAAPPPISASVSIYHDGSVLIVSGGQEMGQGLHTKLKQVIGQPPRSLCPVHQTAALPGSFSGHACHSSDGMQQQ